MQVILETDEAWSIMMLVVSQVLDQVDLSDDAKKAVRAWRSDRADGTGEMSDLTVCMDEALGAGPAAPRARRGKSDEMRATSQEMRVLTSKINEDIGQAMARKQRSQLQRHD